MAVQETRVLPAEFIEGLGKTYATDLATAIGETRDVDLSQFMGADFVAPESQLTQQAYGKAAGLGSYQPFLTGAQQAQTRAADLVSPTAYQQYMSPYQQDVIDTTLAEFDRTAAKGIPTLAASAVQQGAFGQGRGQVAEAEYQTQSGKNRAALLAQLLQQGFGQAQTLAQQAFNQQQALAAGQLNLAQQAPALAASEIAGLQSLGTQQQAQTQSILEAQKQLAQAQAYQPLRTAQQFGAGIAALTPGAYGQTTIADAPVQASPSALQTALGTASTLAGIYKAFKPTNPFQINVGRS